MRIGVSLRTVTRRSIGRSFDLGVDVVQLPVYLYPPKSELLAILQQRVRVRGRYIPDEDEQRRGDWKGMFERLFSAYPSICEWEFGGEPETPPDRPGCRWFLGVANFAEALYWFNRCSLDHYAEPRLSAGGFLSATYNGFYCNEDRSEFLYDLARSGALSYIDAVSVDMFVYGYGGEKNIPAGIFRVRDVLHHAGTDLPIDVSEIGVPCDGDPGFYHIIQSKEEQAISLVRCFVWLWSFGVNSVFWFNLDYKGWGLFLTNPRPAYEALKVFVRFLGSKQYVDQARVDPYPRWMTDHVNWFRFSDNVSVIVCDKGFRFGGSVRRNFRVCDIYGDELIGEFEFGHSPIYLFGPREYFQDWKCNGRSDLSA